MSFAHGQDGQDLAPPSASDEHQLYDMDQPPSQHNMHEDMRFQSGVHRVAILAHLVPWVGLELPVVLLQTEVGR